MMQLIEGIEKEVRPAWIPPLIQFSRNENFQIKANQLFKIQN